MKPFQGAAERRDDVYLLTSSLLALAVLTTGLIVSSPANAAPTMSNAEKIRRLDIMLMVTGLRCRTTADDFQSDYRRFTSNHIAELNRAGFELRGELAFRYGPLASARALDRLSVTMANSYGQGHPWLGCAELKMVARNLAEAQGAEVLSEAADQLLGKNKPAQFVLAGR